VTSGDAPTLHTLYRVGSITKVFTCVAALIAQEKGIIKSIDDPIHLYIPDFQIPDPYGYGNSFTFRQFMTHSSGFPRNAPIPLNGTWDDVVQTFNKKLYYTFPSYQYPFYSNNGFLLLGRILEKIANTTFEAFVQQHILQPLTLADTGFNLTEDVIKRLAPGSHRDGKSIDPNYTLDLKLAAPSGQMYSSADDLITFFSCLIAEQCSILSAENRRALFLNSHLSEDLLYSVGLGNLEQRYDTSNNVWIHGKTGAFPGYSVVAQAVPDIGFVQVTLTSMPAPIGYSIADQASKRLIKVLLPEIKKKIPSKKLPTNAVDLVGTYLGYINVLKINQSIHISLDEKSQVLLVNVDLFPTPFSLIWNEDGLNFDIKLDEIPCMSQSIFSWSDMLCKFNVENQNGNNVIWLELPHLNYGQKYYKQEIAPTGTATGTGDTTTSDDNGGNIPVAVFIVIIVVVVVVATSSLVIWLRMRASQKEYETL